MKGRAWVEVEWVEQVLVLEPLRVELESGLETPLSLEVEVEQEREKGLKAERLKPGLPDQNWLVL